jgi:glycosyltransferase involved in cell wall biosynthesis
VEGVTEWWPGDGGAEATDRRLALVLWAGDIGGAELLVANVAAQLAKLGVQATLVIACELEPLAERLRMLSVSYIGLGLQRGREVLLHPRHFAGKTREVGPDGALLIDCGFMGAALRLGGYRAPIVGVEHGAQLTVPDLTLRRRMLYYATRAAGAWADDAEVGVSDFMVSHMERFPHSKQLRRVYNGLNAKVFTGPTAAGIPARPGKESEITIGFVARLIPGKGHDRLIGALENIGDRLSARLLIAGSGPERARLEVLAADLGVSEAVEFVGVISDIQSFWARCDIAVIPSDSFIESFSMVTLEAMACGKALVGTRAGAIPELIEDGTSGTLVQPGNVAELATAIIRYAERPELRAAHGSAARARAVDHFPIEATAVGYASLFDELLGHRNARRRITALRSPLD